ncbi:hypothetical protein D3C87_1056080 [compost metagenome]
MYEGRTDYRNAGLYCDDKKMVRNSDKAVMAEYKDVSFCGNAVIMAQENFVCIAESKTTSIWSISRQEKIWGEPYDEFDVCAERLTRAFDKKVCRRQNGEYRAVDSVSGKVGAEAHKTMKECEESLVSGIRI